MNEQMTGTIAVLIIVHCGRHRGHHPAAHAAAGPHPAGALVSAEQRRLRTEAIMAGAEFRYDVVGYGTPEQALRGRPGVAGPAGQRPRLGPVRPHGAGALGRALPARLAGALGYAHVRARVVGGGGQQGRPPRGDPRHARQPREVRGARARGARVSTYEPQPGGSEGGRRAATAMPPTGCTTWTPRSHGPGCRCAAPRPTGRAAWRRPSASSPRPRPAAMPTGFRGPRRGAAPE